MKGRWEVMLRYWRRGLAWVILQPSENWHCCHTWRLVISFLHFHKRSGSRMRITNKAEREFSSWEWWTTRLRGVWSCSRNSTDSSSIMKKKISVFSKWSWQIGMLFLLSFCYLYLCYLWTPKSFMPCLLFSVAAIAGNFPFTFTKCCTFCCSCFCL